MTKPKKRYLTNLVLIIVSILNCLWGAYFFRSYKNIKLKYDNYKMSVEYLKNYCMWYGIFNITMYTLHPNECGKNKEHRYYGITKSGYKAVQDRTVAVDPRVVKLGSILIDVETNKKYIAEDTGNNVKGYHIDIFAGEGTKENRDRAIKYGMQRKLFIVIE